MTDSPIPIPEHIRGQLTPRSQAAADRRDWMLKAEAAGMTRAEMGRALGISAGTLWKFCVRVLGPKGRNNVAANKARDEKYRAQRHGAKNGFTYAELHAAGLTAQEAADRRGDNLTVAQRWALETGVKFIDGRTRDDMRAVYRANIHKLGERREQGYRARLQDPERHRLALMTPAQRADYDLMRRKKVPADEAAAAVGCPEAGPTAWEAKRKAKLARERQRRRIQNLARRSPQAALLAMMSSEARP